MELVKDSIVNLSSNIDTFIFDLGNSILDGLSSLGEFLWNGLVSIVDGVVALGELLLGGLTTLGDFIVNGIQTILEFLFVPSNNLFNSCESKFKENFGFVYQAIDIVNEIKNIEFDGSYKAFSVELYGKKYQLIDFSFYMQYRDFIHSIIIAISYFFFALYLVDVIPSVIGGVTSGQIIVSKYRADK